MAAITCAHPLKGLGGGYDFPVPLLAGDHVTDDAGTGFVHTAPGHGREDFDAWMDAAPSSKRAASIRAIPFTVDDAGFYTKDAPGFGPDREGGAARVIDDNGKKGDANKRVIEALIERNALFARGRLKHSYPHSWRSKKPVIFRNTPQWFVYMDKDLGDGTTLRSRALTAIDDTRFVPAAGQNRLRAMIEERPDWVLSRQRAWGVPICVFADADGNVLKDEAVNARILEAFETGRRRRLVRRRRQGALPRQRTTTSRGQQVTDILDVWFDSGSTHTFTLEDRPDLKWPADVYLEGSDQHRGWFHSSLLESCGTRGRAPYNAVVTHGFTMDEEGRKMSKSLGNTVVPQDVMKESGADILRLWVMTTDYWEDQRLGKTIIQTNIDAYRKLRNTIRWMLGTLAHDKGEEIAACRHAGTGAADAAPAGRTRRAGARRLRRLRLQADHPRADRFHECRAVGLLFRHPQGRALLRCAVEPEAPCGRAGHPPSVRLPGDVARADAALHHGGSLADRAIPMPSRCISNSSRRSRPTGRTRRWPKSGRRSARSAASSPARWKSSARTSASARRWKPPRSSIIDDATLEDAIRDVDMAEIGDHQRTRNSRMASRRRVLSRSMTSRASPSWWRRPRTAPCANARGRGATPPTSAAMRSFRMFRHAMPQFCANCRSLGRL